MNAREIARVAHEAGFRGPSLETAVAVALAESGGNPKINAIGSEDSRGLWQINSVHFPKYDEARLYEPDYNAKAAFDISDGGSDWYPWTTWKEDLHRQYLDDARRAVAAKPWRDGPGDGGDRQGDDQADSDRSGMRGDDRGEQGGRESGGDGGGPGRRGDNGGSGPGGGGQRAGRRARRQAELAPWRVPKDGAGSTGRIVVTPSFLDELAQVLTGHLATADEVDRGTRHRVAELDVDQLVVADGLDAFVRRAAHAAVEHHAGTPRVPRALTRDVGYVIEARRRAVDMDAARAFGPRAVDALVASLGGTTSGRTRKRVRNLLAQLGPGRLPTTPRRGEERRNDSGGRNDGDNDTGDRNGGGDRRGGVGLDDVRVGRRWGGGQSVFDQLITPFMEDRGLDEGSTKRDYIPPGSSSSSDHYTANENAYATDYPTFHGEDDARALARRLGIEGWRPNQAQEFQVRIGGARFRVEILWGEGVDHTNHVHVGLKRL